MRKRIDQPIIKLIERELEFGPSTLHDLVDVVKVNARNLRIYLKLMLELKLIHVSSWEQRTGPALPVFSLGNRKDVQRPKVKFKRYTSQKENCNVPH